MSNHFSEHTKNSLGEGNESFYVYALVDPRNQEIFYIGKGTGNRVFDHVNGALNNAEKKPLN